MLKTLFEPYFSLIGQYTHLVCQAEFNNIKVGY
jgi:hypothetical protein